MGGRIVVDSELGAGSTFTVWLPVTAIETDAMSGADEQTGYLAEERSAERD